MPKNIIIFRSLLQYVMAKCGSSLLIHMYAFKHLNLPKSNKLTFTSRLLDDSATFSWNNVIIEKEQNTRTLFLLTNILNTKENARLYLKETASIKQNMKVYVMTWLKIPNFFDIICRILNEKYHWDIKQVNL